MGKTIALVILSLYAAFVSIALYSFANPWRDEGSFIVVGSDEKQRAASLEIMEVFGKKPSYRIDSPGISRAIFDDGTILNVDKDPERLTLLGNPVAAEAFVTDNPIGKARQIAGIITSWGYNDVNIRENIEPGVPSGAIVFVESQSFRPHFVYLCRWDKVKLGGGSLFEEPPKWVPDDIRKPRKISSFIY